MPVFICENYELSLIEEGAQGVLSFEVADLPETTLGAILGLERDAFQGQGALRLEGLDGQHQALTVLLPALPEPMQEVLNGLERLFVAGLARRLDAQGQPVLDEEQHPMIDIAVASAFVPRTRGAFREWVLVPTQAAFAEQGGE